MVARNQVRFLVENIQYDDFRKGLPAEHVWNDVPMPKTPVEVQLYMLSSELAFVRNPEGEKATENALELIPSQDPTYHLLGIRTKSTTYWDRDLSKNVSEHIVESIAPVVIHSREQAAGPMIEKVRGTKMEIIGTLRGDLSWYEGKFFSPTRGYVRSVHEVPRPGDPAFCDAIISIEVSPSARPVREISWEQPSDGKETQEPAP